METKHLKAYAPKARRDFMNAVQTRAGYFGIYEDKIAEMRSEGGVSIIEGRALSRKEGEQRRRLVNRVETVGFEMFIREMAYTWFNRLVAIRYMELHDYLEHGFRVLSHPSNSDALPEIIQHASDVASDLGLDKSVILEMQLAGNQEEALYRELLLGQCHYLHRMMPFMFEAIDDATELLLPDNLTKTDSILKGLISDIPEDNWQEIEVIGWLYQFYISEHKDAVIGKVVKSEDIPAATQLFTPNWIVKYLVQNSVGRQWLATYPDSELKGKMEYYIEPAEQSEEVIEHLKEITPTSIDPEEIKVLDPAMGSGHILVEVYNVLREIYLERGYRLREIPELILTKNIYGLDIDDRAAQLASFTLMMKAREDDRRIFQRVEDDEVSLNVFSLQSTEHLDIPKLWKGLDLEGKQKTGATSGLFEDTEEFAQPTGVYQEYYELLQVLKRTFLHAKTLGSLIKVKNQYLKSLISLKELLEKKHRWSDPAASSASSDFLPVVNQAIVLAQQYNSVVANPPYMGHKYQILPVKKFLKENYKGYEKDLFSSFIYRCNGLSKPNAFVGVMCPNVWMYITTHIDLRDLLIKESTLSSLIELPLGGFKGATVQICSFVFQNLKSHFYNGTYVRLVGMKGGDLEMSQLVLKALQDKSTPYLYNFKTSDFLKLPNSPLAYWLPPSAVSILEKTDKLSAISQPRKGMCTRDNEYFVRNWFEVSVNKIGFNYSNRQDAKESNRKWFPYQKGGEYRLWYGNHMSVVNWENDGFELLNMEKLGWGGNSTNHNLEYIFQPAILWSKITSSVPHFRYSPKGFLFDDASGLCAVEDVSKINTILGFLCSKVGRYYMSVINPTLNIQPGNMASMPYLDVQVNDEVSELVNISRLDWDSSELSWDFKKLELLRETHERTNLSETYSSLEDARKNTVSRMMELEQSCNRKYIQAFGLNSILTPEVEEHRVSLFCNPKYRYGLSNSIDECTNRLRSETIYDLASYSIGCMVGRYSLDKEGLVYAHACNDGFNELVNAGAYKTFPADDDGIIPLASEEWLFDDDATTRFKEFVKTVWGDEYLIANLEFVAESLCLHALKPKKGEGAMDTIRRYFSTQFYKDHCKTYKKRPIYWLFSSGKEKAFECLVYLHRYNEGTLSRMRTEYVTPLMGKYDAQHSLLSDQMISASTVDARRLDKEIKTIEKKMVELRKFDEQLKHYAEMRISLDLDDGVKVNYGKFGNLLADVKAIHGKAVS